MNGVGYGKKKLDTGTLVVQIDILLSSFQDRILYVFAFFQQRNVNLHLQINEDFCVARILIITNQ